MDVMGIRQAYLCQRIMRHRPRTDANHTAIVAALRTAGCAVQSLAATGGGVPDLLLSKNGHCCLAEIKDGEKKQLTPDQEKWIANWKSRVFILRSVEDAVRLANAML